ncbi:hypothetical protein C7L36_001318 [Escherichia coli]|nr:hypothetical protein [Escherichia coli]CAK1350465.1 hypothetical protein FGAF1053_12510 [Escherichia coli]
MENLALTTLMLPFIGALVVSFSPQRRAAEWGFVRRTDHAVHVVADLRVLSGR